MSLANSTMVTLADIHAKNKAMTSKSIHEKERIQVYNDPIWLNYWF